MATIIKQPYNCTFIHIPKTGGNSITGWLTDNFNGLITKRNQHATIDQTCEGNHVLGPLDRDYLGWTFCVVRNPWDYLVSWYTFKVMLADYYIQQISTYGIKNHKIKWNMEFQLKDKERLSQGFDWWVRQTRRKPQHYWANSCDYIMKLENLNEDFKKVQSKLNCFVPLPHLNKTSNRTNYKDYYTQHTIDIVASKYKIDIETYNYDF